MPRRRKSDQQPASASIQQYAVNSITEKNAAEVVASGYAGRLQGAFELQRKSSELVSLRQEIAWLRARLQDDIEAASQFNIGPAAIKSAISSLASVAKDLEKIAEDSETAQESVEKIERVVEMFCDMVAARAVEDSAIKNMRTIADLVSKEATRARVMEAVPTAAEWDVFRKVFLSCVYDGIREVSGLPKSTAEKIWDNIQSNFRARMVLEPEEVAVVRNAVERAKNAKS